MANQFISIIELARQSLMRLQENLVFPNLIYKDYSHDFQMGKGAKVQVRKPVVLEAKSFNASTGIETQDVKEQSVEVELNEIATVDIEVGALEGAVSFDDVNRLFVIPAANALAEKINSDGLYLYKDIPYIGGTAGTTPDDLTDLSEVRRILNENKVPISGRCAVWDTEADAKFTTIPAIVNAEKSGTTAALREGSIGRIFGLDNYMAQGVKKHAKGTLSAEVKPKSATNAGATSLTLSAATVTGTLVKGDVLTILNDHYVVAEDATAASNEITVNIYPALKKNVTTATVVAVAGNHTANLAFNPQAFAFVTRPLVKPSGVESYVVNFNGMSLRVTKGYDMKYKKEMLSMDILYGYKTMYPELAVRYMG
ncbi:P22 phage major capsid protein family protein [Anaerotruncus rubiinfantis]|uniref:P22 phage major capsid protein family protein n=1 Tax=Anaerotruncus rubiinfantis TaxID=1720200 RepID=UPI0034A24626